MGERRRSDLSRRRLSSRAPVPRVTRQTSQSQVLARPRRTKSFEPPEEALCALFMARMRKIHRCKVAFEVDMNPRPTTRVLGGYYKTRRLVRIYTNDTSDGRRPLEELFDTFLHEVAHHLEYTEPRSFAASRCRRVHGLMHSRLFWLILGELKDRWERLQRGLGRRCS